MWYRRSRTCALAEVGLGDARSSARPEVFEDPAVTAWRALVPNAASSGLGGRRVGHGKAVISRRAGGRDGGVAGDGGAGWAGYDAWSAGREPRPLLLAACRELGAGQDRRAITQLPRIWSPPGERRAARRA